MTYSGNGRGRGRGQISIFDQLESPGLSKEVHETDISSNASELSDLNVSFRSLASVDSTTDLEQSRIDRALLGKAPQIMPGAPQGNLLQSSNSSFSSMHFSRASSGRSVLRSQPISTNSDKEVKGISKQGTAGDPIQLIANYIRIVNKTQMELFQYHVTFTPDVENKRFRREIINQHESSLKDIAFDGTTIYSFVNLGETLEFIGRLPSTSEEIKVKLKQVAKNSSDSPVFFHVANLIVRKLLELCKMKLIGRDYYHFDKKIDIERYNLTIFPGISTNVNIYEGSLMVNVDVSHKILNKTTVYQRLEHIFHECPDMEKAQYLALKDLLGQIVLTTYNSSTYRIDDIAWDRCPDDEFTLHDGSKSTFIEYYQKRYQVKICDLKQPLLVSKPSKRNRRSGITEPFLLIPELCCVTGITQMMRFDFYFMKEMASKMHIPAHSRHERLKTFVDDVVQTKSCQNELNKWGMQLDNHLIQLEGRALDVEQVLYRDHVVNYGYTEADWSREGRALQHIQSKSLNHWIVVCLEKFQQLCLNFISALMTACKTFGMTVQDPRIVSLDDDQPESYLRALDDSIQENIDFVLCILSNSRKDRYDALKKYLCLDKPIPSQMVLIKTLTRRLQSSSVSTKIGIQINAKLGGEIWSVHIPTKTLMVVGIDTHHDKKRRRSSVAALVASTNATLTKYYSRVIYQQTSQEIIDGLTRSMADALQEYHRNNNCLPEKIVIYRDGVSDGQLSAIHEHELPQIIETFPKIRPDYRPKLAMIVVKRHGTARFFHEDGRNIVNPPAGTIIDHTVTNADWCDFYLISQCTRQGTVAPTHYNVIWDQTNYKIDHLQRLTFKLCHLYYNWPGTIRVPAVCQYAHKLAYLVGQNLHQDFRSELSDKLFYL